MELTFFSKLIIFIFTCYAITNYVAVIRTDFEGGATYKLMLSDDRWPNKTLWRVGGWYVALIFGQAVAYLLHDYFTLKGKEHAKIVFDFLFGG